MTNFYELTKSRRSIRKFTDDPVPKEDIEYFISCATTAPSGCDSQCWHFIAVQDKSLIDKLAASTGHFAREFYSTGGNSSEEAFLTAREKAVSFFKNAPLVLFVFMGKLEYYDERVTRVYLEKGYSYREAMDKMAYPDVLSIGAAIQNLLLAVTEKGYGACWMNDPSIAEENIKSLLGVGEDLKLVSVIPVGTPRYSPREKVLKPQHEILEYR